MIRLVIADDHTPAATPDEAVPAAERENPDVVLMDLQFGARKTAPAVPMRRDASVLRSAQL